MLAVGFHKLYNFKNKFWIFSLVSGNNHVICLLKSQPRKVWWGHYKLPTWFITIFLPPPVKKSAFGKWPLSANHPKFILGTKKLRHLYSEHSLAFPRGNLAPNAFGISMAGNFQPSVSVSYPVCFIIIKHYKWCIFSSPKKRPGQGKWS